MNKFLHDPTLGGQSFADRVMAAKHSISGQEVTKIIFKATTDEVMGPKRKHLDYLVWCTTNPTVSIPHMANCLIERTHNSSWVVVYKALITCHDLINYGNERFTQFLASNNCAFNLGGFLDKAAPMAYDMSAFIRRYARYLNEKCSSYRLTGYDFCKVKRGKDDGYLRTLDTDKLLKVLPILQSQLDVLLAFNASPHELNNGVIVVSFLTLFKDLIRLFACYNDGIINLLEKYFEMNRKHATLALDIYKKFIVRMEGVGQFLRVAEAVGIEKSEIPDLAKAPSSLLDALEDHLRSMDNSKKSGSAAPVNNRPAASVSTVIRDFSAAAQAGSAPGAGAAGALVITEDERRRILEEEQRQLDALKKQKQYSNGTTSNTTNAGPVAAPRTTVTMETRGRLQHSESLPANVFSDNFSPQPNSTPTPASRVGSSSPPIYTMLAPRNQQNAAAPAPSSSPESERPAAASTASTASIAAPPPGYNSFGEILKPTSVGSANQLPPKIDLAALMISSSTPGTGPTMQKGIYGQTSTQIIPMSPTYVIPMSNMYALPGGGNMGSNMTSPYYMQPRIVMLPQAGGMMAPQWGPGPMRPMLHPQLSLPTPRSSDPFGAM